MQRFVIRVALVLLAAGTARAAETFNILASTPVGSWQVRETTMVDEKGKESVTTMRTSRLEGEKRNGADYTWIEVEMQAYKVKGTERKPEGKVNVMKLLVKESAFALDPGNAMSNLAQFGEEIIIQNGDSDPMRISGVGGMMQGMVDAFGSKVKYDYKPAGNESVTTPAGTFDCQTMTGKGSADVKVIIKTIHVESENQTWLSKEVPFAVVKMADTSVVNGKTTKSTTILLEHGSSGAKSKITKEPTTMPALFGK